MADAAPYLIKIDDTKRRDDIGGVKNLTYVIVSKRDGKELARVERTYDDFVHLQQSLKALLPSANLPLPPKSKGVGTHSMEFLSERLRGLTLFLDLIQERPVLLHQSCTLDFCGLPGTGTPFLMMLATEGPTYIRGELDIDFHGLLPNVGSRNQKLYHKIGLPAPATNCWLAMTAKGADCTLSDENLKTLLQAMVEIQHPFVAMMERADVVRDKNFAVITRRYEARGSLKDIMHGSTPSDPYPKKYFGKHAGRPLDPMLARTYARQILEGLAYLHMKGWPYGHLHTGNILVDNRKCRLSDLENCILGVPPLHLDRIMAWKRCTNVWEADVVCFGAVLYEMTTGQELPAEGLPPRYPDGTSERVKDVLEAIFRPSKPLPTIDDLLKMAYFASVEMGDIPSKFKRTTKVKELLTAAAPQYQNMLARYKAAAKANRTAAAAAAPPAASGPEGASVGKQPSLRSLGKSRSTTQHLVTLNEVDLSTGSASSKPAVGPVAPRPVTATANDASSSIAVAGSSKKPAASSAARPPSAASSAASSAATSPSVSAAASPKPAAAKAPAAAAAAPPARAPAAAAPPPPPPPPPAPPAGGPPAPPPPPAPAATGGRAELLSSITNFKGGLRKVKTNDRSKPKL